AAIAGERVAVPRRAGGGLCPERRGGIVGGGRKLAASSPAVRRVGGDARRERPLVYPGVAGSTAGARSARAMAAGERGVRYRAAAPGCAAVSEPDRLSADPGFGWSRSAVVTGAPADGGWGD